MLLEPGLKSVLHQRGLHAGAATNPESIQTSANEPLQDVINCDVGVRAKQDWIWDLEVLLQQLDRFDDRFGLSGSRRLQR